MRRGPTEAWWPRWSAGAASVAGGALLVAAVGTYSVLALASPRWSAGIEDRGDRASLVAATAAALAALERRAADAARSPESAGASGRAAAVDRGGPGSTGAAGGVGAFGSAVAAERGGAGEPSPAPASSAVGALAPADALASLRALNVALAESILPRATATSAPEPPASDAAPSPRARDSLAAALARRLDARRPVEVLVTGYYEPVVTARRRPDDRFRHPLHSPPPPPDSPPTPPGSALPSRAEIEAGALDGRGLEIFWADDPIELFFLHVQGSGWLDLDDGSAVRVGYAGTNGRPYRSIGALLVERGELSLEEATAPAIKAWLRGHPDEAPALLRENERYVFFRVLDDPAGQGPPGALGAPLAPYRSIAVDPSLVPLGSVGLLDVLLPGGRTLHQVVIAMDTGAAIRGAGRIDLFVGAGRDAEQVAGLLRATGSIAWLAPRRGD